MNYDVLEESNNAINNIEENAFVNHKEEYINVKGKADELRDQREAEELAIKEASSQQDVDNAQAELTKIIDDAQEINDSFNTSIMEVDTTNPLMEVEEKNDVTPEVPKEEALENTMQIDTSAIDAFLNNMNE